MKYEYVGQRATIPDDRPYQVLSSVRSSAPGAVTSLKVHVTLRHSHPADLRLWLQGPNGERCLLVDRRSNVSKLSIYDAPLRSGSDRLPEEKLSKFTGSPAAGDWRLIVDDVMADDGGALDTWVLEMSTDAQGSRFDITTRFEGDVEQEYQDAFLTAASRWSNVIVGDLPRTQLPDGTVVDDVLIFARIASIDGAGGVLGQAGPTHLRFGSHLPISGVMEFDSADMAKLARDGGLVDTITHEMGHVLGFGTTWHLRGLIQGAGTSEPMFVGTSAMREYGRKLGVATAAIPLETNGGPGTAEGHWAETAFNSELMTGWLDDGANPLGRVTVASFEDLGYVVDLARADVLGQMGFRRGGRTRKCMHLKRPVFEVVGGRGQAA